MNKIIRYLLALSALLTAPVVAVAQQGGGGGGGTTLPSPSASSQCFVSTAAGQGNWTWGSCSGSSNLGFASITAGTNTAALVMGTGGSLTYSGSGIVDADELLHVVLPAIATGYLNYTGTVWTFTNPFASPTFTGTVTLSGLSTGCLTSTSGVVSSTGSNCNSPITLPVTVSGTVTSGGVPYFNSTVQMSSSGLLPTGDFMLGGGAGGAPTATFSVVPPVNGGTGVASPTAHQVPVAEGASNYAFITPSTAGLCFLSNGTAADPSFQACPAGSTVLPLTVSGTVNSGGVAYFNSTTSESSSATLAANVIVQGGGAGGAPTTGNADFTIDATAHTLKAGASGLVDLSAEAATGLKIPTVLGAAPTADGQIATNSTTHALNVGSNGSTLVEAIAASGATSVSTTCTNQVITTISGAAAPTCTSLTSAYLPGDVVYNDTANTYSAFQQSFASATMILPSSAGYSPTTAALFGYDSTNARLVFGNGSTTSIVPWFTGTSTNNDCAEATGTVGALTWTTCVYKFSGDTNGFASNVNSTGNVTLTLNNASAHKWWGNNTGSTAAPGYESITTSDLPVIQISGGGTNATSASAGQVPNTTTSSASSWTATPTLGVNGTTNGVLNLATNTTSGASVSIQNLGTTTAWNFNLPIAAGSAGQVLTSQGGGSTSMTWTSPLTNPMTTLGDWLYGGVGGAVTRLAGPTGPNGIPQTITDTPSGGAATAETWAIPGVAVDTSNTATLPATDDVHLVAPTTLTTMAGTNMLVNNYAFSVLNDNSAAITYTPASGSVFPGSGSTQLIPPSWFCLFYTDNTNTYSPCMPTLPVFPNTSTNQALAFNSATGVFSAVTYGTVSSVALTANASSSSGIFAITGSPVTTSGTLNFNLSGTSGGVACFTSSTVLSSSGALIANALAKGGGTGVCPTNSDLQESSNLLNNVTSTNSWTVAGGQDASANSVLGGLTVRGANETGAGGATSAGGGLLLAGGNNAATNAASQGGSIQFIPGASTGSTQGLQGIGMQESIYVKGTTVTQWNLQCENAAMTVVDCAASPGSWLGVAQAVNTNTVQVATDGQTFVNASAAVTLGDTVCAGSTAGKVTDSGGQTTCTNSQGSTIGIVMATSGAWTLPDGTSVTASTTKPLIQMNTAATQSSGGGTPCTTTANSLQYNNSGAFGCATPFTFASSTITAAAAGILDLSGATGATAFKVPVQAGATAGAAGVIDYDSTAKITHVATNAADSTVLATTATDTTTTHAVFASATAGLYTSRAIASGDLPTTLQNGTVATTQSQLDGSTKLATTLYTDTAVSNAVAGVNPAVAVLAASTANLTGTYVQVGGGVGDTFTITATGAFTLDGIAINTIGQRVLLKNQTTASQNGVYTATVVGTTGVSAVFTRALDYDTPSDVNNTGTIPVQSGTVNTTTSWLLTSQVTSIGSSGSSLTYAQFSYNPANVALLNASNIFSVAGAASTPAMSITGAPFTGGSGTTTQPQFYLNAGTAPTTWSTAGTEIGINAPSGFTGNFEDYRVNGGAALFQVTYQGNEIITQTAGTTTALSITNSTAATSSTAQNSPFDVRTGQFWYNPEFATVSPPVVAASAADCWSHQVTETGGSNGASSYVLLHNGSSPNCAGSPALAELVAPYAASWGVQTNTLATPTAPTVAAQGTTGAITWAYTVAACIGAVCTNTPTPTSISNGVTPLTTGNWNKITWSAVTNADYYEVFRTTSGGTPATLGDICKIPAGATLECDDKALTGDTTAVPPYNATGQVYVGSAPLVGGGTGGGMFGSDGTAPSTLLSSAAGWYAATTNSCFDIVNGTVDIGCGIAETSILASNVIPTATGTNPKLQASDFQESSNVISKVTTNTATTIQGGSDAVTTGASGTLTVRGENVTGSTASLAGGAATLSGGDNSSTGNSSAGGAALTRGGDATGGTGTTDTGGNFNARGGNCTATNGSCTPGTATVTGGGFSGAFNNGAGSDAILAAGLGTGTGAPAHARIQSPSLGLSSGTTAQTEVTRFVTHVKAGSTTSATATNMLNIASASNTAWGMEIVVHVDLISSTPNVCGTTERFSLTGTNNGGAFGTVNIVAGTTSTLCSAGTLTLAVTATAANPSVIAVTPTWATITAITSATITVTIENVSQQEITLL